MQEPDQLIHQPSRLRIMAALTALPHGEGIGFVPLKALAGLTDGNLSSHLSTLEEAGYVSVDKGFEGKKPKTQVWITSRGRQAFAEYVKVLEGIIKGNGARAG
jgi:DNA-binding transcriptional ArsR family regulator